MNVCQSPLFHLFSIFRVGGLFTSNERIFSEYGAYSNVYLSKYSQIFTYILLEIRLFAGNEEKESEAPGSNAKKAGMFIRGNEAYFVKMIHKIEMPAASEKTSMHLNWNAFSCEIALESEAEYASRGTFVTYIADSLCSTHFKWFFPVPDA